MTAILKVDTIQDTSGNNIINENANTITIGKAGDTTNIVGTLQNDGSALISGITMADQWRLITNKANVDTPDTVFDSNLERIDTSGQGTIGSAMTESSGVFTFPSTGLYWVHAFTSYAKNADRRYCGLNIKLTTNNSSYSALCEGYETINPVDGNNSHSYVSASSLIDVSNFNNVKVRFGGITPAAITALGNTTVNLTCFTFIRLGDT